MLLITSANVLKTLEKDQNTINLDRNTPYFIRKKKLRSLERLKEIRCIKHIFWRSLEAVTTVPIY